MTLRNEHELPPDFLKHIDPEKFSIPELIGLVIAASGQPLSCDEIADCLTGLGIHRTAASLRKSWHAGPFLRKNSKDKLTVVPAGGDGCRWEHVVWKVREQLGLIEHRTLAPATEKPVDDKSPVTPDEVLRGLSMDLPTQLSLRRKLALLTEAMGGTLAMDRAIEQFSEQGVKVSEKQVLSSVAGSKGPVFLDDRRLMVSVPGDNGLRVSRYLLREKLAEAEKREKAEQSDLEFRERLEQEEKAKCTRAREAYKKAGKLVIRCFFSGDAFAGASLLDPDQRRFHDVTHRDDIAALIEKCDVILGLDPWADLERLAVPMEAKRLVDLSPPVKNVRSERGNRPFRLTARRVIEDTLRSGSPLAGPRDLKTHVKKGNKEQLFKRLRSDLVSLWRLFEFGCLHGYVVVEFPTYGQCLSVYWNFGRLEKITTILERAFMHQQEIEVVMGSAPGWDEPWARGRRIRVLEIEGDKYEIEFCDTGDRMSADDSLVFAARPASGKTVRRFDWPDGGERVC